MIYDELKKLGATSKEEWLVLSIFGFAILAWILRSTINEYWMPEDFPRLKDASISMVAAFAMFTVPACFRDGKFLVDWEDTSRLPWGILILFGGGLALASAMSDAGII